MGGRAMMPGEAHPRDLHDDRKWHDRVELAEIGAVDTRNGVVDLEVLSTGKPAKCTIALGGLTVKGPESSWRRYMPGKGHAHVGHDQNNQPFILAPAAVGEAETYNSGESQEHKVAGYARMRERRDKGLLGFTEWFDLKEGEWHDRSSGGASVFGSATGELVLAAGLTGVTLDKQRFELELEAGMIVVNSEASSLRLGDVKAKAFPTDLEEVSPLGSGKAWHLHVEHQAPFGVSLQGTYDEEAGDVRDGLVPRFGPTPAVVTRYDQHLRGPGVTGTLYRHQIDASGASHITHPPVLVADLGALIHRIDVASLGAVGGTIILGDPTSTTSPPLPALRGSFGAAVEVMLGLIVAALPASPATVAAVTGLEEFTKALAATGPTALVSKKVMIE